MVIELLKLFIIDKNLNNKSLNNLILINEKSFIFSNHKSLPFKLNLFKPVVNLNRLDWSVICFLKTFNKIK